MFGIGLAKDIIKDNKKYPKRVGILGIVILIIGLIFLFRWLFSFGGIVGGIAFAIFLFIMIILFISIEE